MITMQEATRVLDALPELAATLETPQGLALWSHATAAATAVMAIVMVGRKPPAEVVPIRPAAAGAEPGAYVYIKEAAHKLGMSRSSLESRLEEPAFKALRIYNGTNRVLFSVERIEHFMRTRRG